MEILLLKLFVLFVVLECYLCTMILTRVRHAFKRNATCLDGSDAHYYLERNALSKNWVLQLEGGGACITKRACQRRAASHFGSSLYLNRKKTGYWVCSSDIKENPHFHSWNKVIVPYCSGDLYVGRRGRYGHPFRVSNNGHYIVTAVVEDLINRFNIHTKNSKILFGGQSAGGVGVLANIDHVTSILKPAQVSGVVDGGWVTLFPDYKESTTSLNPDLPNYFDTLNDMFTTYWNGFADESCRQQSPISSACLYGELVVQHIETPLFIVTSLWDTYQLQKMSGDLRVNLPPIDEKQIRYLKRFSEHTYRSLASLPQQHGVFAQACFKHTYWSPYPKDQQSRNQGRLAYKHLVQWYTTSQGGYVENAGSCSDSCCSAYCNKCTKRSSAYLLQSSLLVCFVAVLLTLTA